MSQNSKACKELLEELESSNGTNYTYFKGERTDKALADIINPSGKVSGKGMYWLSGWYNDDITKFKNLDEWAYAWQTKPSYKKGLIYFEADYYSEVEIQEKLTNK